ncbi:MAG: hypothetical protein A2583_12555 [Bdellovibrionales bacterium RIFOXYD1_FULL_53_11]|nr:MAG: hypothetical protein A2583_12555 [Bdellovibrionales bacterium RIFOXYD1_FULL_53_11]
MTIRGFILLTLFAALAASSCSKNEEEKNEEAAGSSCIENPAGEPTSNSTGAAFSFLPDPMADAANATLSPTAGLDEYRKPVTLERLNGRGLLEGKFADVRDLMNCNGGYNARDGANKFTYSQSDPRFQEAMTYHMADSFIARLDANSCNTFKTQVRLYAHCIPDNAYYSRGKTDSGQTVEYVCIGDSSRLLGASFADDAMVGVHELQHGITVNAYSSDVDMNVLYYDEAGALGEALSDFAAISFFKSDVPENLDQRLFSRWALGVIKPVKDRGMKGLRGANRCPMYDSAFRTGCSNFRAGTAGFSSKNNTISYVYPDGMGWPFPDNYSGPAYVKTVFESYRLQEEIHEAGLVVTGALYDAMEALEAGYGYEKARDFMQKLVVSALKHLPKPSGGVPDAGITFIEFARTALEWAETSEVGLTAQDKAKVAAAFEARGLYHFRQVPKNWAAGSAIRIIDSPVLLKNWLANMGVPGTAIPQGANGALNDKMDPGEVVVLWFNIENLSEVTAGGLLLEVASDNPNVTFLHDQEGRIINYGYVNPVTAQIRYGKINGSAIVDAINDGANVSTHIPVGTAYFSTNPFYDSNFFTALWVKVSGAAAHGEKAGFTVVVRPANGEPDGSGRPAAQTLKFIAVIN